MDNLKKWQSFTNLDSKLKQQLLNLSEEEIRDCFNSSLEFGTAGMRGLLGVGPNRINIYTVAKANTGYAKYILGINNKSAKVVIAYDNRHQSKELAMTCAKVNAKFGIETYVFSSLRPTPELSFAVRFLKADGGIVITASHNPKEYNGYKVYDQNGCQLTPDKISKVIELVNEIDCELDADFNINENEAQLIHMIDKEIDQEYSNRVLNIGLRKNIDHSNLKIVFTPQHGTAYPLLFNILKESGYNVELVLEQCNPDPDFSNTLSPNPEERKAYDKAIELAKKVDADIVLSTDPDADRMGIVVKHQNEYHYLTGNQGGTILLEYILSTYKEFNNLPVNGVIYNTIVTSDAGEKVAKLYGVNCEKTLTGFKFIGEKIENANLHTKQQFIMGYEESYGYLLKDFVRDKDALQSCLMLAEAASFYKSHNKTLIDVLEDVFSKIGYHLEETVSLTLKGLDGLDKMKKIMNNFRNNPFTKLIDLDVVKYDDYLVQESYCNDEVTKLDFPKSDVLKYYLSDGSWLAIRPSGTEPKCKFYYGIIAKDLVEANQKLSKFKEELNCSLRDII